MVRQIVHEVSELRMRRQIQTAVQYSVHMGTTGRRGYLDVRPVYSLSRKSRTHIHLTDKTPQMRMELGCEKSHNFGLAVAAHCRQSHALSLLFNLEPQAVVSKTHLHAQINPG